MRFKDLVANSLPRVRGRKTKKAAYSHAPPHVTTNQEPEFSTCPRYYPQHPVLDSRESSVERSSTVAVVDVPWRENAVYKNKVTRPRPGDLGLMTQQFAYYTPPPPQQRMVMSHSADGISSQATMALLMTSSRGYINGSKVTTISDHYANGDCQHHNMSAISESAVNYIGPNCFYHSQYQHEHHHHHHSHDHHYIYHHHHHRQHQNQAQIPKPTPLAEKNHQQVCNSSNPQAATAVPEKPRKSESGGFFRKSFASFRAMRKQGSRNKEQDTRQNPPPDENDKCLVCPYPQAQCNDKNSSDRKQLKQSRKGLKSLTKSKKKKDSSFTAAHDHQSDASWYSDNDTKNFHQSHLCNLDALPYTAPQQFPIRECSMESSISHQYNAGSREGSCVRELDNQHLETTSLSGYDSDVAKNRTSRSRSRIKTNPWLPSPQPSLTMGRRFENCHFRESHEDVMEEDNVSYFPRSASFDYHSQLGVSSFQAKEDTRRSIQRHRSLTPVDLKLNLSLPKPKPLESEKSSNKSSEFLHEQGPIVDDNNHLNDLNTNLTKSRPNSIVSPNSEFIALADNIEQLANNISFEYEEMFDTSLETESGFPKEKVMTKGNRRSMEENNAKRRKSDLTSFPADNTSDNAHSPDSGIACLGSCDGDDAMAMGNSVSLEQSPTISTASDISQSSTQKCKRSDKFQKPACQSDIVTSSQNNAPSRSDGTDIIKTRPNCELQNSFTLKCETSPNGQHSVRLHASSSNESLNSAVISESDIDNTSYKYSDNSVQSCLVTDSSKPLNSCGSLMVDERLDINFRSLPRKAVGNRTKKVIHKDAHRCHTIGRTKNVPAENDFISPFRPLLNNSLPHEDAEKINKLKSKQSSCKPIQMKSGAIRCTDKVHCEDVESKLDEFPNDLVMAERDSGLNTMENETLLMVDLNTKQWGESNGENDVTMNGQKIDSQAQEFTEKCMPLGEDGSNPETLDCIVMDTAHCKNNQISNTCVEAVLDTVDVSVQTDFCVDFESWERRQTSPLPDLDDSFDPVESTRRWLLSGNMQGSADTGYSSQPRDSHIFMDEEAALLQFDALSDKGYNCCPSKLSGEFVSQRGKTQLDDDDSTHGVTILYSAQQVDSTYKSEDNEGAWVDRAQKEPSPGSESHCQGLLNKLIRRNTTSNADISKRHSSDSSTSTLTSDQTGLVNEIDTNLRYNETSDGCGQQVTPICIAQKNRPEPDYVNLPSQNYRSKYPTEIEEGKINGSVTSENFDTQIKCSQCLCLHPSYDSQNSISTTKDFHPKKEFYNISGVDSFRCLENSLHFDEDRADYLEFLRDAPLQKSYCKNPVFIIPGFGPVEFSSESNADFEGYAQRGNMNNPSSLIAYDRFDKFTRPDVSPQIKKESTHLHSKDSNSRKGNKTQKVRKDERAPAEHNNNSMLLSYSVPTDMPSQMGCNGDRGEKAKSCHPCAVKRKPHHNKDFRTDRCPTMQSYEVDSFSQMNKSSNLAFYPGQCSESSPYPDKFCSASAKDNSTRSLAERVSLLRREKEIIYRKIQEVQQQELSRQREQLQQQRHLHSQRKEELLETLHDLKEKLEEQSKKLQMKCREEI